MNGDAFLQHLQVFTDYGCGRRSRMKRGLSEHFQKMMILVAAMMFLLVPRSVFAMGYARNSANGTIKVNHLYTSEIRDDASLTLTHNIIIEVDEKKTIKSIVSGKENLTVTIKGKDSSHKMFKVYHRGSGSYNGINLGDTGILTVENAYLYVDATKRGIIASEFNIVNSQIYCYAKDKDAVRTSDLSVNNTNGDTVRIISSNGTGAYVEDYARLKSGYLYVQGKDDGIYCKGGMLVVDKDGRLKAYGKSGICVGKRELMIYGTVDAEGTGDSGIKAVGSVYGYVDTFGTAKITAKSSKGHGIYASKYIDIRGGSVKATGSKSGLYADRVVTISAGAAVEAEGSSGEGIYAKENIYFTKGTIHAKGNGAVYACKKISLGTGMTITLPSKGRIVYRTIGDGVWISASYGGPTAKEVKVMYTVVEGKAEIVTGQRAGDPFRAKYTGSASDLVYTFQTSTNKTSWTTVQTGTNDTYYPPLTDSGKYLRVIVTSKTYSGNVVSPVRTILTSTSTITKQPVAAKTKVGVPFKFSIAASYVSIYQWRVAVGKTGVGFYSVDTVKQHAQISGQATGTVTITPTDTWLNGKYILCMLKSPKDLVIYSNRVLMTVEASVTPTPTPTPAIPTPPVPVTPTPTPTPVPVTPTPTPTPVPATPTPTPSPVPAEKGVKLIDSKGVTYTSTTTDSSSPTVNYTKPASGMSGSIAIPMTVTIDGVKYRVTGVSASAFKNKTDLTKMVIGKYTKSVGKEAFSGCTGLKELVIGSNVTSIGEKAFYKCTGLTSVTIPAKVNKIGKSAFAECKNLKNFTIKTKLLNSNNVGSKAVNNTHKKSVFKVPAEKLETYKKLMKGKGASHEATYKAI